MTVAAIHTALAMVEPTKVLFANHLPDVRLINIIDESLIQDIINAGFVPLAVKKRLINYYYSAVDAGADIIFNTCSSVGEVASIARDLIPVPLIKIDEPMAIEVVSNLNVNRIGVIATLNTTLGPTFRMIGDKASEINKKVTLIEGLANGAFQAIIAGDRDTHDAIILQTALGMVDKCDAFVLAQGSMARMADILFKNTGKQIYSSPLSGVLSLKSIIEENF
jgi:hypothetical protein